MHDGLPTYKYIFKNGTLDNGADNPDNKCFCRKDKCLAPGLIDVTDCYYGKIHCHLYYLHFTAAINSIILISIIRKKFS